MVNIFSVERSSQESRGFSHERFNIAYKKAPEFDEQTLNKYPFLKGYTNIFNKIITYSGDCSETTSGELITNLQELEKYILSYYGEPDDTLESILKDFSYAKDEYDSMAYYINKGYNVISKEIDYCDDVLKEILFELNDDENFIVKSEEY